MVRPTTINKKPYTAIDVHNIPLPPVPRLPPQPPQPPQSPLPPQDVQRPDRPETPSPTMSPSLKFMKLRRHRMHKISRGLLHVHKNGLRTRKATCPANATCVGFDDIGEFIYNQARKCRHLRDEANRLRNPDLPPITDKTPVEFVTGDPGQARVMPIDVVVEIGPPHSGMEMGNCWDQPSTSNNP